VLAAPAANAAATIEQARVLSDDGACLAVFPELGLTGYSIDDLLLSDVLLAEVLAAIETIRAASADLLPAIVVGAPLRCGSRLCNCAVVIQGGVVLGVAPKSYLPDYREFYEKRHFAAGVDGEGRGGAAGRRWIALPGVRDGRDETVARVPFGPDLLFEVADVPGLTFHVEVCEDMWVPVPPSSLAALAGATVLVNLSGSPITVGRAEDRKLLARASSSRGLAAYVFAAAGQGESSTDLAWDGQTFVYENGVLLGETERFPDGPRATVVDVDVEGLLAERLRQGSFDDNREALAVRRADDPLEPDDLPGRAASAPNRFLTVRIGHRALRVPRSDIGLRRVVDRFPFVPDDPARLAQDCYEAYNIQVAALVQRLRAIGSPRIVIGVSGGLDSTHALIVAARAVDRLGLGREHIHAITMPGFATSAGTKSNALALARALGCQPEAQAPKENASARPPVSALTMPSAARASRPGARSADSPRSRPESTTRPRAVGTSPAARWVRASRREATASNGAARRRRARIHAPGRSRTAGSGVGVMDRNAGQRRGWRAMGMSEAWRGRVERAD